MLATGTLHKAFCENAKNRRHQLGLTQKEMGEKLGISTAAYTQFETGRSAPTLNTVEKIAAALGIPAAMLLTAPAALEPVG